MEYYTSQKITDHIIRIRDICGVFSYLVIGEKEACLIDTGDGYGDLYAYVKRLTDKKCFVILTHGHLDHINGCALFEKVYLNLKDEALFHEHNRLSLRQNYAKNNDITKEVPLKDYCPERTKPLLPLADQQMFDLGGIRIQVIATPGHTSGMMMVFFPEERIMLFGDGCGQKVLLFNDQSSTVSEYLKTLQYVKSYEPRYDRIIRNHTSGESPKILLDDCIACCQNILNGTDAAEPTVFNGQQLFSAHKLNEHQFRADGGEGNILYRADKRC